MIGLKRVPEQSSGLVFAVAAPRLVPGQQMLKFKARSKTIVDGFVAGQKLPEDTVTFGTVAAGVPCPSGAAPSSFGGSSGRGMPPPASVPGEGATSTGDEDDEEMDEAEAEMLGLAGPGRKRKSNSNAASKAKRRSKEEMYNDEVDKIEQEVSQMIAGLAEWPKKPTGYEIGMLDRKVSNKLKQVSSAGQFNQGQRMETFQAKVKAVRDCTKAAGNYLPSRGLPRKQHAAAFWTAFSTSFETLPEVVNAFPPAVQQHFIEMGFDKDFKAKDWPKVAQSLNYSRLSNIYAEEADKMSVSMFEQVLAHILEIGGDQVSKILSDMLTTVSAEQLSGELVTQIPMLIQLVTLDPQGATSFDMLVNTLQTQSNDPIIRIMFKYDAGKEFVAALEKKNEDMLETATKISNLLAIKDGSGWVAVVLYDSYDRVFDPLFV